MCVSPVEVSYKVLNKVRKRVVPCGKCPECVKKAQSGYMIRTIIEARQRGSMWFFTLTYRPELLPYCVDSESGELIPSLRRDDVKKMFHDVRQRHARNGDPLPDFAWLYCGEYGPQTHRPHYHGCFLGLPDKYVKEFEKYWSDKFGFVVFKKIPLLNGSGKDDVALVSRYVAKYITKPSEFELDVVKRGVVEKPRKVCSVGFGMPFSPEFVFYHKSGVSNLSEANYKDIKNIVDRLKYTYNGFDYALPQYIIKKLFYEKNVKGNLSPSALFMVVKAVVRSKSLDCFDETLRQMREKGCSDEAIGKALAAIQFVQENDFESRRSTSISDLQTFYQKSKF